MAQGQTTEGGAPKHILLSSMGASGPRESRYCFERSGSSQADPVIVTSGFSATALWQLLPKDSRPDEIWFLMTPKAVYKAWGGIEAEGRKHGVRVVQIPMEGGDSANDASVFLETTAQELPEGVRLTLDVTQGLRHHAFLFFALALYVSRFRSNNLEGIWYSRLETDEENVPKPVIDLKPVLDLANWFLGISEFQDTGSLKALGRLVGDTEVGELMVRLSREFLTGLPLEAGVTAHALEKKLRPENDRLAQIPLESQVRELISQGVKTLASEGYEDKSEYRLDDNEIKRQGRFIRRYLETGQDNLAFGLMREWLINRILVKRQAKEWLKNPVRRQLEDQLNALSYLRKSQKRGGKKFRDPNKDSLTETVSQLGADWDDIVEARNTLQHSGMRPGVLPETQMKRLKDGWQNKAWDDFPQFGGGGGTLLICPVGNTPGVLYTALAHAQPHRCLVICSEQTKPSVSEAVAAAEWSGDTLFLVMADPHSGIKEFDELLDAARGWLFQADRITANLTGGTSLMGVLVGQLIEHAGRAYRRPTRKFVLIDRRPYETQRDEPWVQGDIHYLDGNSQQAGEER